MKPEQSHENPVIPIFIDGVKFDAPTRSMTGEELRNLPKPPVSDDRDLWLEVPGKGDDELIEPSKHYEIKPGSNYYTAPRTINPGA